MPVELTASYLGLQLSSPVIVGACPLTVAPEAMRQFVEAGAGAVVLPSMLQEQVVYRRLQHGHASDALEQSGYQPQQDKYNGGAENYLKSIAQLSKSFPIPIIASLNGTSDGPWIDYAREIQDAGASALEVNLQPAVYDPSVTSDQVEARFCRLVARVVDAVSIPVAVKVSQRYTNLASMAHQLQFAGASGIVLFTHLPQWDVSVDRMQWTVRWELSPADSLGGILEGIVRVRCAKPSLSIAASGGIATSEDAVKAMIAGADVVMVTSAVYREGPSIIRSISDGIERHLMMNHYRTLEHFQRQRPAANLEMENAIRLEYIDPLTRSKNYFDPSPLAVTARGDAHGHREN